MNSQTKDQNVFADLANLEESLSTDHGGERARALLDYFNSAASVSERILQTPLPTEERHLMSQLLEGFRASQRIVRDVWESMHAMPLGA